jgi:hypothetical protein
MWQNMSLVIVRNVTVAVVYLVIFDLAYRFN